MDTSKNYGRHNGTPARIRGEWGAKIQKPATEIAEGDLVRIATRDGRNWFMEVAEIHSSGQQYTLVKTEKTDKQWEQAPEPIFTTYSQPVDNSSDDPPRRTIDAFLGSAEDYSTEELLRAVEQLAFILEARAAEAILKEPEVEPEVEVDPDPEPERFDYGHLDGIYPDPLPEPKKPFWQDFGDDDFPF